MQTAKVDQVSVPEEMTTVLEMGRVSEETKGTKHPGMELPAFPTTQENL